MSIALKNIAFCNWMIFFLLNRLFLVISTLLNCKIGSTFKTVVMKNIPQYLCVFEFLDNGNVVNPFNSFHTQLLVSWGDKWVLEKCFSLCQKTPHFLFSLCIFTEKSFIGGFYALANCWSQSASHTHTHKHQATIISALNMISLQFIDFM